MPFSRKAFEKTIRYSGRAVDTNLAGFGLGYENACGNVQQQDAVCGQELVTSTSPLIDRIETLAETVKPIATYGIHRLVDYQDADYAHLYLDRLQEFNDQELLIEVARHLALWMGFEDVIRVADLKTRAERSEKIATEIRADEEQIWYGHDYFHPRYQELTDLMPAHLGRGMAGSNLLKKIVSPFFSKGRIIRPKTILGYMVLRMVANLRFMRRKSLRFTIENKRIEAWLFLVAKYADDNPSLALEIAKCPRLIKGYGDTHARGINRFSGIMAFIEANEDMLDLEREVAKLKDAALASSEGGDFNQLIEKGMTKNDAQQGEFKWAGSS